MKKPEDIMLWRFLKEIAQGETVDYVVQELRQYLGEDTPTAEEVRRYLLDPVDTDGLNAHQRTLVMDQLLECAEVNFRTLAILPSLRPVYQMDNQKSITGGWHNRKSQTAPRQPIATTNFNALAEPQSEVLSGNGDALTALAKLLFHE